MLQVSASLDVRRKLAGLALGSLLAVLTMAGSSAYLVNRTMAAARLLLSSGVEGTALASKLDLLLQTHKGLIQSAPAELDRNRLAQQRDAMLKLNEQLAAKLAEAAANHPDQRDALAKLSRESKEDLPALFDLGDRVLKLSYNFVQDKAVELAQGPYAAVSERALRRVSVWRDRQVGLMDEQITRLTDASNLLTCWIYGGTTAILAIGILFCLIVRSVLRRLFELQRAVARLTGEEKQVQPSLLEEVDEIEAMNLAIQTFQANARQVMAQEIKLREVNARLDVALNNMSHGLCQFSPDGRLEVVNQQFSDIVGLDRRQIHVGQHFTELMALSPAGSLLLGCAEDTLASLTSPSQVRQGKRSVLELAGGRMVAIHAFGLAGGGWVATYEDITARHVAEAQISYMARHDALTELPNRLVMKERLEATLATVGAGAAAVLSLDLDRFKKVNDTLGHPAGDALLQVVAKRLLRCVRQTDMVARLGGDEFAIIQADMHQPLAATSLAARIVSILAEPFDIAGTQVLIGASVGIALVPAHGVDPDLIMQRVDIALYQAKAHGRGQFCLFETDMDTRLQERRQIEADMRQSLADGDFTLVYQPIVNIQTSTVSGFEALLRWRHPGRGMVPPAEFVPLAEQTGLIGQLGAWVIERACADAKKWRSDLRVAVNLSPLQFGDTNLVDIIRAALSRSGLPASRLELEITESALLHDNEGTLQQLHELRSMDATIAMDDFGTGYSSLGYVRSFPFDKIKIDQCFVQDLSNRPEAVHIVRAIGGLATGFGTVLVAEGVETAHQLAIVRAEGCAEVQGYFFSKPIRNSEVPATVEAIEQRLRDSATLQILAA